MKNGSKARTAAAIRAAVLAFAMAAGMAVSCPAEDRNDKAAVRCGSDRASCVLLQTVMMGEFESLDPEDMLYLRIYSSVLPMVSEITGDDINHYLEEFGGDESNVRETLYRAISNCLLADILYMENRGEGITDVERVLLLFLDASLFDNSDEQIREIRERAEKRTIDFIAEETGVPSDYVSWLMGTDS